MRKPSELCVPARKRGKEDHDTMVEVAMCSDLSGDQGRRRRRQTGPRSDDWNGKGNINYNQAAKGSIIVTNRIVLQFLPNCFSKLNIVDPKSPVCAWQKGHFLNFPVPFVGSSSSWQFPQVKAAKRAVENGNLGETTRIWMLSWGNRKRGYIQ
jgi:hypothetical protein